MGRALDSTYLAVDAKSSSSVGNATSTCGGNSTPADDYSNCNYTYNDDYYYDDDFVESTARRVASALVRYLFPVIVLVGTTGNGLSAAVMLRPRMRETSIYCYLLVLAVVDVHLLLPAGAGRRRHDRPLRQRVQDVAAVRRRRRVAACVELRLSCSDVPVARRAPSQRVVDRLRQRRSVRGRLDAAEGHHALHTAPSANSLRHRHRNHRRH